MPIAVSGAIGPCEAPQPPPLSGVGVATGVVGVTGADVAVAGGGTDVAVGGTDVAVGGTRVAVAVGGTGVAVGGTCVAVAVGVAVGGTSVAVGTGVGNPKNMRLTIRNSPGVKPTGGLGGDDCMPFSKNITGMSTKLSSGGATTRLLYSSFSTTVGSDS